MDVIYSSDELKSLVRILNDILNEARKCRPELSTDDIVQRFFMLADRGERDARTLHDAVFDSSALEGAEPALALSERKFGIVQFQYIAGLGAPVRRQSAA